jgi:hypothetical protein
MNKAMLLTAASIVALSFASPAAARPFAPFSGKARPFRAVAASKTLYGQNSKDTGNHVNSQNFTGGTSTYTDAAADDFVVPRGQTWRITEVDVTGVYFNAYGPAASENVTFYRDKRGKPGDPVARGNFANLNGTGGPDFILTLPGKGLKLRAGKYWVSVVANLEFYEGGGEWGWEANSVQHGKLAMWENPFNGFGTGCTTWGPVESCLDSGPDLMFDLRGISG